ncbi:MAG: Uncharacterised protein [Cellulomonadaceae bacterium TMED98]|nr:MAG: Uncharacterised protein [Cellulomonadaceae bacterium TMED98]
MRRVCWSGWVSAALLVAFVLVVSACTPSEPLVPEDIQQAVNADDRERNYDLAWQEIRSMAGDIERGELDNLTEDSLVIVSRMERLERGEATGLSDRQTAAQVAEWEQDMMTKTVDDRIRRLGELARLLPQLFDPGEFAEARLVALEIHAVARTVNP